MLPGCITNNVVYILHCQYIYFLHMKLQTCVYELFYTEYVPHTMLFQILRWYCTALSCLDDG